MTRKVFYLLVMAALMVAAVPAYAIDNGDNGGVDVIVDGNQWFYDATEDPFVRLHEAWVLPCGENPDSEAWVYYYEWDDEGHPDEIWVDMGFPIAIVEYSWHYGMAGGGDYWGEAFGTCFEAHEVVPMMYLYTSETGFFGADPDITNTCSIVSDVGPAGVERIAQLCATVPEDINLTCAAPVWQMSPTDYRGHWGCDSAQHALGEIRLPLFSEDGGGGKGTLYEVYMRHLGHLEALGLLP